MVRVGIIGLGMMGNTHLDVYAKRDDVEVVAIADMDPRRLSGEEKAGGNIEGQASGGFDINAKGLKKYDDGKKLIRNKNVDLVAHADASGLRPPRAAQRQARTG